MVYIRGTLYLNLSTTGNVHNSTRQRSLLLRIHSLQWLSNFLYRKAIMLDSPPMRNERNATKKVPPAHWVTQYVFAKDGSGSSASQIGSLSSGSLPPALLSARHPCFQVCTRADVCWFSFFFLRVQDLRAQCFRRVRIVWRCAHLPGFVALLSITAFMPRSNQRLYPHSHVFYLWISNSKHVQY